MDYKGKVLIVENNGTNRHFLKDVVSDYYDVSSVRTTDAASEYLDSKSVDLVITDLDTHDNEGLSFLEKLKLWKRDLPVMIWTENPSSDSIKPLLADKNYSYLIKTEKKENILYRIKHSIWPKTCNVSYTEKPQALLVDNEDVFSEESEKITEIVGGLGYSLIRANNAPEIFRSFQSNRNSVVLLNYAFSGSGDIVRRIKQTYPYTRVIGYSEERSDSSESSDFLSDTYPELIDDFVVGGDLESKLKTVLMTQVQMRADSITDRIRARPPRVYLVAGARGSGKTLLRNGASSAMPWTCKFRSATTGSRRYLEQETDHSFISESDFFKRMEDFFMVYYYERDKKQCLYGLDRDEVTRALVQGRDVIFSVTNPKTVEPFIHAYNQLKSDWGLLSNLTTILVSTPRKDLLYRLARNRIGSENFEAILEGHSEFEKMSKSFDFVIENPGTYERLYYNQMSEKELNVVNRLIREFCGYVWDRRFDEKAPF